MLCQRYTSRISTRTNIAIAAFHGFRGGSRQTGDRNKPNCMANDGQKGKSHRHVPRKDHFTPKVRCYALGHVGVCLVLCVRCCLEIFKILITRVIHAGQRTETLPSRLRFFGRPFGLRCPASAVGSRSSARLRLRLSDFFLLASSRGTIDEHQT